MKNNIDINEIWKNQEIIEPNLTEFIKNVNSFKNKNLKNIIIVNVLLLLTSVFIFFIWIYFQPKLITTKVGIVTTIIAMLIYVIALNKTITINKEKFNVDNNEYLLQLINLKNKQKFLQNTMLKVYFILFSIGLCLYLIEYVQLMNLILGIIVYSLTLLWIAINWFYFRPKIIKKQNLKINELISRYENINYELTKNKDSTQQRF
jgi:hypothetical protein